MALSDSQIHEFRETGREVDLDSDLGRLWHEGDIRETFLSVRAYANYVIEHFQHEDFERDATECLVGSEGPYAGLLDTISLAIDGQEFDSECGITFDSMAAYMTEADGEWRGDDFVSSGKQKYVSDDVLAEFVMRYLTALWNKSSGDDPYGQPEWEGLPNELGGDFKEAFDAKLRETFSSLVGL